MKKRVLALALVLTMCVGAATTTTTASAATKSSRMTVTQFAKTEQPSAYKVKITKSDRAMLKKLFNAKEYAAMYPDVYKAYGNNTKKLWQHFITYGIYEGRSINEDLNIMAYSSAYPDLRMAYGNDLMKYYKHYATYGYKEDRNVKTLEDAANASVKVIGMDGNYIETPTVNAPGKDTTSTGNTNQTTPSTGNTNTSSGSASTNNSGNTNGSVNNNTGNTSNADNTNSGTKNDSNNSGDTTSTPNETPAKPDKPSTPDKPAKPDKPSVTECDHGDFTYEKSSVSGKHYKVCGKCHEKIEESCVDGYIQLGDDRHVHGCYLCGDYGNNEISQCWSMRYGEKDGFHTAYCLCGRAMSEPEKCDYELRWLTANIHGEVCKVCGEVSNVKECTPTYVYNSKDTQNRTHDIVCADCGHILDNEICDLEYVQTSDGTHKAVCKVCGHEQPEETCDFKCEFDCIDNSSGVNKYYHVTRCLICDAEKDREECTYVPVEGESNKEKCTGCGNVRTVGPITSETEE